MDTLFVKPRIFTSVGSGGTGTVITTPNVIADGLLGAVPIGYMLEICIVQETGGTAIAIQLGLTAGTNTISPGMTMGASQCTSIVLNRPPQTTAYNVYISDTGAGWGVSILNVYLILRKVF